MTTVKNNRGVALIPVLLVVALVAEDEFHSESQATHLLVCIR
jgi:hypothetical protein